MAVTVNEQSQQSQIARLAAARRGPIIVGGVVVLLTAAVLVYWLATRGQESTDDAQVNGHMVIVTARVAGHVRFVTVDDTDQVSVGQLLVQLDRRDLLQSLERAQADLASQIAQTAAAISQVSITRHTAPSAAEQAAAGTSIAQQDVITAEMQVASAEAQVVSAEAAVRAAQEAAASARTDLEAATAQVKSARQAVNVAEADVVAAKSNAETQSREEARYKYMLQQGAVSRQQYDNVANVNTAAQSALRSAQSNLDNAKAGVEQAVARESGARALLARANSLVTSSSAALTQARANVRASRALFEQARSRVVQAQAAEYAASTVPQQISASEAQKKAAAARIAQSRAAVRSAQLSLSYTSIKAPVAGEVVSRNVNPGQYVQPGQALLAIVPLNDVWVTANFKETQIRGMRPGQRVDIRVDTYSGRCFRGTVKGIGAASGEKLSLLPPENATGNFVKVVQRIPVRIVFDQPIPDDVVFRPGQNVVVTVYTR